MHSSRLVRPTPDEVREFEQYVAGRGAHLARLARLLAENTQAAEDLLQTTLVRTLSAWSRVRKADDVDAYVGRIMVNAHRTDLRRRPPELPTDHLPDRAVGDRTGEADLRQEIVVALRRLPPGQRIAVVLRYYADLSESQTAAMLDCSVGTVRSQTARGLQALRAVVSAAGDAGGRTTRHRAPRNSGSRREDPGETGRAVAGAGRHRRR